MRRVDGGGGGMKSANRLLVVVVAEGSMGEAARANLDWRAVVGRGLATTAGAGAW